jgi:nitrogen fixation protein FixH
MPDLTAIENTVQQFIGPYLLPVMVGVGLVVAVWVVFAFRALQTYNASDAARLDQIMKHR